MREYKIQIDEEIVKGKAIDIVKYMRTKRFTGDDIPLEELLKETAQNAWRLYGKSLSFDSSPGTSLEYKCEQFINAAIANDLLKELKR